MDIQYASQQAGQDNNKDNKKYVEAIRFIDR